MHIHICSFESTANLTNRQKKDYEMVKKEVLKAGRFSVFEACDNPSVFEDLHRDPDLTIIQEGFPWLGVKRKREKT